MLRKLRYKMNLYVRRLTALDGDFIPEKLLSLFERGHLASCAGRHRSTPDQPETYGRYTPWSSVGD
jgi:hypothetical protein